MEVADRVVLTDEVPSGLPTSRKENSVPSFLFPFMDSIGEASYTSSRWCCSTFFTNSRMAFFRPRAPGRKVRSFNRASSTGGLNMGDPDVPTSLGLSVDSVVFFVLAALPPAPCRLLLTTERFLGVSKKELW